MFKKQYILKENIQRETDGWRHENQTNNSGGGGGGVKDTNTRKRRRYFERGNAGEEEHKNKWKNQEILRTSSLVVTQKHAHGYKCIGTI
jgi:hypothetical protein